MLDEVSAHWTHPKKDSAFLMLFWTNACFGWERIGVCFNPDQPAAQTNDAHGAIVERVVSKQNGLLCVLKLSDARKTVGNREIKV